MISSLRRRDFGTSFYTVVSLKSYRLESRCASRKFHRGREVGRSAPRVVRPVFAQQGLISVSHSSWLTLSIPRIPLISQPIRQTALDSLAVLPQQPLHVQHARPALPAVPRRVQPPVVPLLLLQLDLQQPQRRQRRQQCLCRPLDRVARPGAALLPA